MNRFLIIIIFLSGMATTVAAQTGPTVEEVRRDCARGVVLPESDGHTTAGDSVPFGKDLPIRLNGSIFVTKFFYDTVGH
ncbi:MAG: hypothetical protein LBL07_14365 [Tannerella sp.]|jgi:hypothetical protein|nr:hypothetical protein [Tannerella sp.]